MDASKWTARVRERAADTLVGVCWRQFSTLGFAAPAPVPSTWEPLIDPEMLLLMGLGGVDAEPRLEQALAWWAAVGADLTSLARLNALRSALPETQPESLAQFAARAVGAKAVSPGWKRLAGQRKEVSPERLKGVSDPGTGLTLTARPLLLRPPALMLRMRAMSGVGAKADVFSYLMAFEGPPVSVQMLRQALGYSQVPLRRATGDLVAAGVVAAEATSQGVCYAYSPGFLAPLAVAPWRDWRAIGGLLLSLRHWGEEEPDLSAYLLSSQARRLAKSVQAVASQHALSDSYPILDPRAYAGEAYLEPFVQSVDSLLRWIEDGLPSRTEGE